MITAKEKRHLAFLKGMDADIISGFCDIAIKSIREPINPKVYISAGAKLKISPVHIENATHAILSIIVTACEKLVDREQLEAQFVDAQLDPILCRVIGDALAENRNMIEEYLSKMAIKTLEYKDFNWRLDIIAKTKTLDRIAEPVVTMELLLENTDKREEKHIFQTDPKTLAYLTANLEEALQQSRSLHMRKLQKTMLTRTALASPGQQ